ncbi:MAG: AAA family ATPase, partial [Ornithinibacter sp.]
MAAILVGRAEELGRALELVRGARHGRFGAVIVHGDAGTGKTTLLRAACAEAGDETLVLSGSCLPLTSVSVPLMGLRSALRAVPTDERPPGLGRPSTPSGSSSSDVAAPVPVAFDDWLSGRARQAPLVLALDDIHWADAETLDVLTYVLAGPEERRLVLLLTVRTSEVGERHPLWRWLADARRLPGVEELTLGPLSRDEIGEEVSLVLGAPAHSTLVDKVFERSQGNPYFARLLVTGLDQAAASLPTRLPEQLHAAALGSWSTLSDDAQRLLRSLAVAGRPALGRSLGRIAHVADLADPGPALREAVDAGLVDVGEDGSCWFHHPLQAEALELGLLPDERRVLHGRFAAGYEEDVGRGGDSGPDGDLAETISDHHILAGHEEAAYGWALRAASSRAGHDGIRRVRMLRRAVDLRPRLERVPESLDDLLDELR